MLGVGNGTNLGGIDRLKVFLVDLIVFFKNYLDK